MSSSSYKPAPEIADRKCGRCGKIKPMRKRRKDCDDCAGVTEAAVLEMVDAEKLRSRPASLGYELSLQEGDYVIEQDSARGLATVYLHPEEAQEIAREIFAREANG